MNPDTWMTRNELALALGVSRTTIRRWEGVGHLNLHPVYLSPRRSYYRRAEVAAWLEDLGFQDPLG